MIALLAELLPYEAVKHPPLITRLKRARPRGTL
jgi:hypothetical protein